MLSKLLKHDFKKFGRELLIGYIILLVVAVVTKGSYLLADYSIIFMIPYNMMLVLSIILLVGLVLFTFFIAIKDFYKSFYKDEAYLVNTLPVKKSSILTSKILISILYLLISLAVVIIAFIIIFHGTPTIDFIRGIFTQVKLELNMSIPIVVLLIVGGVVISFISYVLFVFAALAIGHTSNSNKIAASVLFGVLLYFGEQIVGFMAIGLTILIDNSLWKVLTVEQPFSTRHGIQLTIIVFAMYIVLATVYYLITKKMLEKKYNLE